MQDSNCVVKPLPTFTSIYGVIPALDEPLPIFMRLNETLIKFAELLQAFTSIGGVQTVCACKTVSACTSFCRMLTALAPAHCRMVTELAEPQPALTRLFGDLNAPAKLLTGFTNL